MAGTINDGGPAFPMQEPQAIHAKALAAIAHIPPDQTEARDRTYTQARSDAVGGMSLRDYFAAAAISGLVAAKAQGGDWVTYELAKEAYWLADAMLNARGGAQ